ncbi:MAG: WXG100 family type VII secretion target [Acutalibacteraceae bacterium]
MALIQVTPDLLKAKASELRGYKAEHEEAMNKMRSLMMNLNEIWKGDAQDALLAKYESMQNTFTQFAQMLEDYAKLMDTSAEQMSELDASLASQMNSFGG